MRKATSAKVSKLASKLLNNDNPIDGFRARLIETITDCGIPMNAKAANALVDRIGDTLAPFFEDARSLAASCLSQDETPGEDGRDYASDIDTPDKVGE